jgi:5-methyltetrahydrofolate--homocysteine methyltransferase
MMQDSEREMGVQLRTGSELRQQIDRSIPAAKKIPSPSKWGARLIDQMPLEIVFNHIDKNELFRLSWGAKNTHGEKWVQLKAEYEERLAQMQRDALQEKWLKPQGMYGYWPAQSQDNHLIVYDPDTLGSHNPAEIARFSFPRQEGGESICIADYFASVESGIIDVVALQVVTVGKEASAQVDRMQTGDDYSEAYFNHGLAVQTAEAAAEYLHQHIRNELGLAENQGKRYSWGYPAVPDLHDHRKVFDLLPVETELGMSLTSAYQLIPEQSTAAIIVHHSDAKYFSVGTSRVEQLMRAEE